jgi:hypothetical protein
LVTMMVSGCVLMLSWLVAGRCAAGLLTSAELLPDQLW